MDGHLGLQPLFKHADGLMPQVVIRGNATISQWLNGPIVLRHKQKQRLDKQKLGKLVHLQTLLNMTSHLLYLHAVRALQVPQALLHQAGQVFVNGLVAYVFKAVETETTHRVITNKTLYLKKNLFS